MQPRRSLPRVVPTQPPHPAIHAGEAPAVCSLFASASLQGAQKRLHVRRRHPTSRTFWGDKTPAPWSTAFSPASLAMVSCLGRGRAAAGGAAGGTQGRGGEPREARGGCAHAAVAGDAPGGRHHARARARGDARLLNPKHRSFTFSSQDAKCSKSQRMWLSPRSRPAVAGRMFFYVIRRRPATSHQRGMRLSAVMHRDGVPCLSSLYMSNGALKTLVINLCTVAPCRHDAPVPRNLTGSVLRSTEPSRLLLGAAATAAALLMWSCGAL